MKRLLFIVLICLIGACLLFFFLRKSYGSPETAHAVLKKIIAPADVAINGSRPWDITVNNPAVYQRILDEGSLGLGESYMDGWWDCPQLDELFYRIMRAEADNKLAKNWSDYLNVLLVKLVNYQSKSRAFEVGEKHYDLSNDLFACMLDKHMIYSCAYWKDAKNLDEAQEAKLDLICRKLHLKPGMKVLDIGCGWGGLACYMARHYGCTVVGVTISKEQEALANERKVPQLPVTFRLQDYRECNEKFDRIVSIGMFEHVGHKNYKEFMVVVDRCLKPDGLCLLHTIGNATTSFHPDPWVSKYIFPNGILPSLKQITHAAEGLFVIEDVHNFGADYDKTLMAWHNNFEANWPRLPSSFDERFYRMWKYYLLTCAGVFRARGLQLWQIVLSKPGLVGGYSSVR